MIEIRTEAEWRVQRTRTPSDQRPGRDCAYDARHFHGITSTSAEEEGEWELLYHLPAEGAAGLLYHLLEAEGAGVHQGHAWQQVPWDPAILEAAGPLRQRLYPESGVGSRP